ncbi:hypothetical protein SD77_3078 [Bacillus badius]|uniref:Ribose 5-phosphate isomerase B n=1 Tax=Bacillus badius TaxID=1455 RepID=A0ABR5AWT9_BACBA|nr:hypothetical protein SD78_0325 [Bacillus badius]KIL79212.1 hypothetical protein SD77_3078 [Bacillus badius]
MQLSLWKQTTRLFFVSKQAGSSLSAQKKGRLNRNIHFNLTEV